MKSLIWDLLLLLLFMCYQSKLRVGVWEATHGQAFSLDNKCADDILLSDLSGHIVNEKQARVNTDVADPVMPVEECASRCALTRSLISNTVDPELIRFRHYPAWFQNFLLKLFPDMYKYRDPKASTHPFKFGHDYYLYPRACELTRRPTLIIQMVLVCYTFLCFSSMTEMNVSERPSPQP